MTDAIATALTRAAREDEASRRIRRAAVISLIVLLSLAALGFFLVVRFAEDNRARDLSVWRDRLAASAQSRAEAVDAWIGHERDVVATVARNPTIQFFLTELGWTGTLAKVTDGEARLDIMKNYLLFTGEQTGFAAAPAGPEIAANIERKRRGGLAVLDASGRPVVATPWMPDVTPVFDAYRARAGEAAGRGTYIHDLYAGAAGEPTLAFLAPVFPIDGGDGKAVGYVVGIRLADGLFARLGSPEDEAQGLETLLLRQKDALIEVLAAKGDALTVPAADKASAVAFALASPGELAEKKLGADRSVLVVGAPLTEMPWTLARVIDADRATGEIMARRNAILVISGLVTLCFLGGLLMLWRYGASLRAAAAAARARVLAEKFERLNRFLTDVTDSQPTRILAFDMEGSCRFANGTAARAAGAEDGAALIGKSTTAILGPELGTAVEDTNRQALAEDLAQKRTVSVEGEAGLAVYKTDHIPLELDSEDYSRPGVLVVIEDISELVQERERRENNLRQLVRTLTGVIDSRDPYAARHSRWVAELSEAIAQDMGLEDVEVETAEIAGALLNLGKVLVPRSVLTKGEALTEAEIELVRRSMLKSADLLQGVDFNGPVVATIRQATAMDQSTLEAGAEPLLTARIVVVANAFVGMISARAHRQGLPIDRVIELLLAGVGTTYDRRPVASLINYLENKGGRAVWEKRAAESGNTVL